MRTKRILFKTGHNQESVPSLVFGRDSKAIREVGKLNSEGQVEGGVHV